MLNKEKGFTLVELLAVLVLLGLILHFSTVKLESFTKRVEKDVIESDFRIAKSSITQHYLDQREIPIEKNVLQNTLGFEIKEVDEQEGVKKYQTKNKKDSWNRPYIIYVYEGDSDNSAYFSIVSIGPDGKKSTDLNNLGDDLVYIFYPTK